MTQVITLFHSFYQPHFVTLTEESRRSGGLLLTKKLKKFLLKNRNFFFFYAETLAKIYREVK